MAERERARERKIRLSNQTCSPSPSFKKPKFSAFYLVFCQISLNTQFILQLANINGVVCFLSITGSAALVSCTLFNIPCRRNGVISVLLFTLLCLASHRARRGIRSHFNHRAISDPIVSHILNSILSIIGLFLSEVERVLLCLYKCRAITILKSYMTSRSSQTLFR